MTKKRDRYLSGFDAGVPGIRAAVYDIGLALYILEEIAKEHDLLHERTTPLRNGESWSVAQLLEIAREALNQSVSPVADVYVRLQQNAHAAEVVSQTDVACDTSGEALLSDTDMALWLTLNNKAIFRRAVVSQAERILAQRTRETAQREAQQQSSEKEPYIDDWCADPTLSHDLCTNSACECSCHTAKALAQP